MAATSSARFRAAVYAVIRQVPCGKVTTYGSVAWLAGAPRNARRVGWALRTLPAALAWGLTAEPPWAEQTLCGAPPERATPTGADANVRVPWHRVVNAQGRISGCPTRSIARQAALLRAEGIAVDDDGALIGGLDNYLWQPDPAGIVLPDEPW